MYLALRSLIYSVRESPVGSYFIADLTLLALDVLSQVLSGRYACKRTICKG